MTVKKLGENTLYYTASTFLRYSVTFILIPVYTAALTVSEYGALETINVTIQSLLILMTMEIIAKKIAQNALTSKFKNKNKAQK